LLKRRTCKCSKAFFRGDGDDQFKQQPRQFRHSNKWYATAEELAREIAAIEHWPGWTQHCRLLRHAAEEAEKQQVQELVIVSDAFEERTPLRPHGDDLTAARIHARRIRDLGTRLVVAYKGTITGACPLDRAGVSAEQAFREVTEENEAFREITEENGGYCFLLNPADLAERFGAIATEANLAAKGDAVAAQKFLEHQKTIPFKMNVVGEQVSAKCNK
jgi:hypothetical protein